MLKVDFHVKVLNDTVVDQAKARGLDAIVYAPHFVRLPEIQQRAESYSDEELLVIPAREVFAGTWRSRKHIYGIGLQDPVPDFITLDGAISEFVRQEAAILVPHPLFATVSLDVTDLEVYQSRIHGIETYNPKFLSNHNLVAANIADSYGFPVFASSYAHLSSTVGHGWTTFPKVNATETALIESLRSRSPRTIGHSMGVHHWIQCLAERYHLLYENTWAKFNRVVISGQEPTHPSQEEYEGRFDEVMAYK